MLARLRCAVIGHHSCETPGNKLILLFEGYLYGDTAVSESTMVVAGFTPCGTGAAQAPRTTTKHLQNQGFGVSTPIGVRSRAKRLIGAFQAVRRSREPRIGVRSVVLARSVGHGCDKSNPHKVGDCG